MKAVYLTKYGESSQAFEIRQTNIPVPEKNEVLIRVHASGLNFADVMARRGLYRDAPPLPAVLGYDVAGVVESLGEGVSHVQQGDRVLGFTRFGGYAEMVTAKSEGVVKLHDDWDFAWATALGTQASTAVYLAEYSTRLYPGEKVLIQAAAGGVGRILVQLARHYGCEVYGTASGSKQEYLKELGVHHPIDYTREDFYSALASQNTVLDVVFDNLGGKRYKQGLKLLGPTGRILSYGAADQNKGSKTSKLDTLKLGLGFGFHSPIPLVVKSQSMIGVNMLRLADYKPRVMQQVLNRVIDLTEQGIIDPRLDRTFQATQIAEAHDWLESRQSMGKVAIIW